MVTGVRRGRPSKRSRVLDAATAVALRDGPGAVTIEAVVSESGLSRGGVLYHFPSKDTLLQALVDRDIDAVRDVVGVGDDSDDAVAVRRTRQERVRAYQAACVAWPPDRGRVALAVALAEDPELLRSWADLQRELDVVDDVEALGSDGAETDAGVGAALAARLALDGLWFSDLIDPDRFTNAQRRRLVEAIIDSVEAP